MTRTDPGFAYSQPRLQARLGARPTAAEWQQLESTRDLGALLQVLRGGPLERWTARLPARPGVHEIERCLREEWLEAVDEVAGWQPRRWRETVAWMRWIAWLPALQQLARGGRAAGWMRDDPVLGPIVLRAPRERAPYLGGTPLAPLAAGFTTDPDVAAAWATHWPSLWPVRGRLRQPLEQIIATACAHRRRLAESPPEADSREAATLLERRLRHIFRRHPFTAAAAAAYLGLVQVDLRRLRGLLAVRALRDAAMAVP